MNYNNWPKYYEEILDDFNFSRDEDIKAAHILNNLMTKKTKIDIGDIDCKDKTIIFGAGPSLDEHIHYIKNNVMIKECTLIASDGATTALLNEGIIPNIIVTDLDGNMDDIISANKSGSILFVHAHGDNIDKLEQYVEKLDNIIPTCQCESFGLLKNYGGFTDGDRAVHIAYYGLGINTIILAGMDFGSIITNYSRPEITEKLAPADKYKKLKLEYAQRIIESLKKENYQLKIFDLKKSS